MKKPPFELSALIKSIEQNDKNQKVLEDELNRLQDEKVQLLEYIKMHEEYEKK